MSVRQQDACTFGAAFSVLTVSMQGIFIKLFSGYVLQKPQIHKNSTHKYLINFVFCFFTFYCGILSLFKFIVTLLILFS